MTKYILGFLIILTSSLGWAQANPQNLRSAADAVRDMVHRQADLLSPGERRQVMEKLREIRQILTGTSGNRPELPGVATVPSVSRRSGGETYTLTLVAPTRLTRLEIGSSLDKLRVYETQLITLDGRRVPVAGLSGTLDIHRNALVSSEPLTENSPIRAVEVRAEAWASGLQMQVVAFSSERAPEFGPLPEPLPDRGYFCTAACANSIGQPDLAYSAGASAPFESQARQAAREQLRKQWSCHRGVVDADCERSDVQERFFCLAGCAGSIGQFDPTYAVGGSGFSATEALNSARANVRSKWTCNRGIANGQCSSELRPHYCVAACADSISQPDLSYSKGATGVSEGQAMHNALEAVRGSWSCHRGIVIASCEGQ